MLDIATLGIGLETKSLERGQRALDDLQRQGNKTADTLDKTGARGSAALGKVASSATAAGAASQTAFGKMVTGATGAAGALQRLQAAALPALAAAFGVTQVIQAADAYTQFTAQLKLATESQAAYNQALQTVQRISSSAQGSISAVGTLYARIARNTEQLGFSQLKVAAITESVALALKANGASGAEAASAMLQLSQAFGAGALRGEEFNAINEAAPNLIRAIADSLGVTQGEMKKLAEEGLITSAVMGEALPAALEQFRSEAAQVRTIGGAFTELGNSVTTMIGQVGNSTGVIGGVSDAITGLASIVRESGPAITGLLTGIAAGAVVAGLGALAVNIGAVSTAVKGLAVSMLALAANPVVLAILGIGAVVGGIAYLGARKEALEGNVTAIQKLGEKTEQLAAIESRLSKVRNENGELKAGVNRLAVIDDLNKEKQLRLEIGELEKSLAANKTNIAAQEKFAQQQSFNALTAELDMQDQIAKELERIAKLEKIAGAEAANAAKQALEAQVKQAEGYKLRAEQLELENKLGRALTPIEQRRLELQAQYGEKIPAIVAGEQKRLELAEAQSVALKAQADAQKEADKVIEGARDRVKSIEDQIKAIQEETAKIGLSTEALNALEIAKINDTIATKQQRIEMISYGDANDDLIAQYRKEIDELENLRNAKMGLFRAQDSERAIVEQRKVAQALEDDLIKAFEESFLRGGDFAKSFKRAIEAQFAKLVLRPIIQAGVQGALGIDSQGASTGEGIFGSLGQQSISKAISNGFTSIAGSLFGSASAYAAAVPGLTSAAAGSQAALLAAQTGSFGAAGTAATAAAGGSTAAGFASSALAAAPYIAAAAFIVSSLRSKKISATNLNPADLKPITEATQQGFDNLLKTLRGTGSASFGIGGNTGRQGQNPNFNLSGSVGGRTIFSSSNTAEGQADGLFQRGEIALNDANIADQTTRAIVAALKLSDFADNIDAVIASLDPLNGSLEDLNAGLQNAQILATLNETFKDMEGALGTLANASIETIASFVELTGGIEGLQQGFGAFYDAFYSEQEKTERLTKQVTNAFTQFGRVVPSTRDELVALVDGLDLQDQTNQRLLATIFQLTPALNELLPAFEQIEDAARSLFGGIPGLLQDAIGKQISLSRQAANEARSSASAYLSLSNSLKEVGKGLLTDASGSSQSTLRQQFNDAFGRSMQGDKEALSSLGGLGKSLADSLRETAVSSVDFAAQSALIKLQLDQAAEVANALGLNENYQAQLFDIQTAALEVLNEQLNSGNVTEQILNEHSALLQGIANEIAIASNKTISQLLGVEGAQLENVNASSLIAQFTGGSETLLSAVLNRLAQQDSGSVNIIASLNSGNAEITNYLAQLVAAVQEQSAKAAAEAQRQQQLAQAQTKLSEIATQRNTAIAGVQQGIQNIRNLESQLGAPLSKNLFNEAFEQAIFKVNSEGLFEADFDSIFGDNAAAFKNAFYASGGAFDQTYGQASNLVSLRDQLQAQRDLITSLGGIPQFAKGGMHSGGLRLVGERGPELEVTGPSRIIPNNQLMGMMRGGGDNTAMISELRALREEVKQLRSESRIGMSTIAQGTNKTANLLDDVTNGNERFITVVEPM